MVPVEAEEPEPYGVVLKLILDSIRNLARETPAKHSTHSIDLIMAEDTVLKNPDPLKTRHIPETIVDRENAVTELSSFTGTTGRNLFLHGSRGTGKTTVLHHLLPELESKTCYIPCTQYNTQYQVLRQIYQVLTQEQIGTGHHTSDLQRELEKRTGHTPLTLILDDVDFLLLNDGDSLLYYLSRLENQENLSIILVSSNHSSLQEQVEERTYSSLQPRKIPFEPYNAETLYQLLQTRAEQALKPQSLHREALSYIVSTTSNAAQALHWLKTSVERAEDRVTEQLVASTKEQAHHSYIEHLLEPFTDHHHLVYQAIEELVEEAENETVNTGAIYNRYQELCQTYEEDPLSNRRISDYLKHLELLHLIQAKYCYGGRNGKTREITAHTL